MNCNKTLASYNVVIIANILVSYFFYLGVFALSEIYIYYDDVKRVIYID